LANARSDGSRLEILQDSSRAACGIDYPPVPSTSWSHDPWRKGPTGGRIDKYSAATVAFFHNGHTSGKHD
jgi:hypothetical protein